LDPSGVDRLEEVDAAEERALPGPRGSDEADDLVLADRQVDPAEHLERPERLVESRDPQELTAGGSVGDSLGPGGRAGCVAHRASAASCRRRSRATSQSV